MAQKSNADISSKKHRTRKNQYWLLLIISIIGTVILKNMTICFWLGLFLSIFSLAAIVMPVIRPRTSVFVCIAISLGTCIAISFVALIFWLFTFCVYNENSVDIWCTVCGGDGLKVCNSCGGDGIINCYSCKGTGKIPGFLWDKRCKKCTDGKAMCHACNGNKQVACGSCGGTGKKR